MISKQAADYVAYHTRQQCKTCTMFRASTRNDRSDHCTVVAGAISPVGHCRYYERKSANHEH